MEEIDHKIAFKSCYHEYGATKFVLTSQDCAATPVVLLLFQGLLI